MVLIDPAAMTAFWEQEVQMRIVQDIRDQLELDGLTTFESFADYTKDDLSAMRKRISYIQDIPHFGQDSFKRLVIAFEASRNYKLVGREITAAMMHYENTLKHFAEDWKTIVALEGRPEPPVPTICRALPPMKWVSAFVIAMQTTKSARFGITLYYVIRPEEVPEHPAPPLEENKAFAQVYGSLWDERQLRASHSHPAFKTDDKTLFQKLDEAVRSTNYVSCIEPFRVKGQGRKAFFALIKTYLGDDKWLSEITKYDNMMRNAKWKGAGNLTVEAYIAVHRNAYQHLVSASEHVAYQLPNQQTRVKQLLDGIISSDARLNAAIAMVQASTVMVADFEMASAHIQPHCPVAKRNLGGKRQSAEISAIEGDADAEIASVGTGGGTGPRTGVHLRFHTHQEYYKLGSEERKELAEWRLTPAGKAAQAAAIQLRDGKKQSGKGSSKKGKKNHAKVSAALVKKQVAKALEASKEKDKKKSEQVKKDALLASLLADASNDPVMRTKYNIGAIHADEVQEDAKPAARASIVKRSTAYDPNWIASILEKANNPDAD